MDETPTKSVNALKSSGALWCLLLSLVALILIGMAGAGSYLLQQSRIDLLELELKAAAVPATPKPATFHESQIPFTFRYPSDWTKAYSAPIQVADLPQTSYTISFEVPGTVTYSEPIGSTSTFKGMGLRVIADQTTATSPEAAVQGKLGVSQLSKASQVAGLDAVEYLYGYETETNLCTAFIKDKMIYKVCFAADDGTLKSRYLQSYRDLLASFAF